MPIFYYQFLSSGKVARILFTKNLVCYTDAMTAEERIASLEDQLTQALEQLRITQEELAVAYQRIEEWEKQKTPPAGFVKANGKKPPEQGKKKRKKRAAQYNRARRREVPTQVVEHGIRHCPVCANALGGISVARRRQVIELPPLPPSR